MAAKVKLSSRLLTEVFWSIIFQRDEERIADKQALFQRLNRLDDLRATADYNTGSISPVAAWSLYSLTRHFKPKRIIEVGTFIGKSTISMATGLEDQKTPGKIFTCDASNSITLPWDGQSEIKQFQSTTSGEMFKAIDAPCDMVFLDGRLKKADLELLDPLITEDTVFVLDDFEGMEKGVINLTQLVTLEKAKNHFLLYPPSTQWLAQRGYSSHSVTAVLLPVSSFVFAKQG
jgi:predicted O-methyltransferase YrrM